MRISMEEGTSVGGRTNMCLCSHLGPVWDQTGGFGQFHGDTAQV